MKLRTHLIILVVAALLPVLIFAGVMLVQFSNQQRSAVENGLVDTARALSLAVDRELAVSIRTLEQLATSEHLDSGELRKFYDQASRTLKIEPSWEAILLIDPFGQQVINLRVPFGTPLPETGAPQLNKEVIETGQPAISNLFTGAIVKGPLIAIGVPVVRNGKVKYVLALSASPAFLLKLLAQQNVPSDWLATIIDRNQVIVARTRDFEKFVGKPASALFAAKSREAQEGAFRGLPYESAPVYSGFHRSDLSGWTVGFAIPVSAVESPLRRSLLLAAAGGLVLLLLGIALATLFGHRVTASVGALCGSAVALGRGETPQRRHSRIVELNEVGGAIETAAATRKRAEEEIRRLAKFPAENPNPVIRIGRNGTILYANQSSAPILTTWGREVGQNVPDDWQKWIAAAFESGISKEMDIERDGRIFSCILAPILAEGYLNVYGQDITERKEAEKALQVQYNELQTLREVGNIILTSSDLKPALARVLAEILPACSLDLGVVRLLDAKSQNLEPIASLGFNDLEDENKLRSAYLERGRDPTVDHVLTEKKTVVLENLRERGALRIMQREGIQSAILLPIKTEQQVLGILQVGNRTTRRFQPDEVRLLEGAGNLIGIGVQKAQLYEKTHRNLERIRALHEIDRAITSTLDLRTILDVLLEKIYLFLPYSAATIRLWNEKTRLLEPVACRNINEKEWKADKWKGGRGSPNIAFETKATISIANCQTDPRVRDHEFFRKNSLVSYVGVPLIVHDQILGVISFYTTTQHEFTSEEIGFLGTLASQAAIAINNSQTYEEVKASRKELELTNQYLDKSLRLLSGLYTALTPLAPSESIPEMMDGIIARLKEVTGADAVLIRLWDDAKDAFAYISHRGYPDSYAKGLDRADPDGAANWVFTSGEPIISPNTAEDTRLRSKRQLEAGFHSCAILPLKTENRVRGLVYLASNQLGYFDEEQSDHLMAIARQMGIALENRELFDGLKASRDELEMANKVKDEFLSIMSHEMRTPLNVVVGYSGMIMDGMLGEVNEKQKEAMGKIIRRANDQLVMINNVLYATVLETEKTRVESHELSLGDFLTQLKTAYEVPINKKLVFNWDYPADLPLIMTDSAKLKQILQNLIENAIKFTDKGSVTVSARIKQTTENRQEEDDSTHASRLPPHAFVEFKVADTGAGIPKEALPMIFDKFKQADSSETRVYGGVGMGLYIVKKFAELLGGQVEVESEVGKGTTFTVTLPCES